MGTRLFSLPPMPPRSPPWSMPLPGFMSGVYSAVPEFTFRFPRPTCTLYRPHRTSSKTGRLVALLPPTPEDPPCERCCSGPACLAVLYGLLPSSISLSPEPSWQNDASCPVLLLLFPIVGLSGCTSCVQSPLRARVPFRNLSISHGSEVGSLFRLLPLALSYTHSELSQLPGQCCYLLLHLGHTSEVHRGTYSLTATTVAGDPELGEDILCNPLK